MAEIILGYADLLLHQELKKKNISGYEMIRYRDDYRIFCNDKVLPERIPAPTVSLIHPIGSIQSIGSIASIHPRKSNTPFWSCLL